jgi:hypothetical protein
MAVEVDVNGIVTIPLRIARRHHGTDAAGPVAAASMNQLGDLTPENSPKMRGPILLEATWGPH